MAIEPGVVTKIGRMGAQTVWVRTEPCGACESCSSREMCGTKTETQKREVEVDDPIGAMVGDRIQISISTASLIKATFLLYLFPVLCMLAGGIAGNAVAPRLDVDASVAAAIAAFLCLAAAMLVVRVGGNRMARKAKYRPRIVRILGHDADAPQKEPVIQNPAGPRT
jgi:sigma-E factor negative regulatory protein RseC